MVLKTYSLLFSSSLLCLSLTVQARHRSDGSEFVNSDESSKDIEAPDVKDENASISSRGEERYVPESCSVEEAACEKDTKHLDLILKFAQDFENSTGTFVSFKMSEIEALLEALREADLGEEAWAAIKKSPEDCKKYFLPVVKIVADKSGIENPEKFTSEFCKEAEATGSLVLSLNRFLGGVTKPSMSSVAAGVGAILLGRQFVNSFSAGNRNAALVSGGLALFLGYFVWQKGVLGEAAQPVTSRNP